MPNPMTDKSVPAWARPVLNWLDANGRSQEWLARQVGVSAGHLNHCLHGTRPSDELLAELAGVMGVDRRALVLLRKGEERKP